MAERPKPAKIQLPPPGDGKGHWHYERDFSRDLRYSKPQLNANNFLGVLLEGFNHKDLYILLALPITAVILGAYVTLRSAFKIELWIDRTTYTPPWDWARVHNKYWKMPTQIYDPAGVTHERLSTMEKLEDGLVEAAQKRGTRDGRGYLVGK
uniref:NADH dehydrogenase [ubiquinone] 1 alpha subcomplex subunit 13 n=1 Tax=Globodera pallida TaxID=36090 RepID=A0A183CK75_GLOPA